MTTLRYAVIGTFYKRTENSLPLLKRLYIDATRKPDEAFLMCESQDDADALHRAWAELYELELVEQQPETLHIVVCPTPQRENGSYEVIPYSNKINHALALTTADAIVYLDNNSDPKPEKYQTMIEALEANPDWGAVYCTQKRTGYVNELFIADEVVPNAYCRLNYTQVMHRLTNDRWPLDMHLADPDLADGVFWSVLHNSLGDFFPCGNQVILDEHHMEHSYASGIRPGE